MSRTQALLAAVKAKKGKAQTAAADSKAKGTNPNNKPPRRIS